MENAYSRLLLYSNCLPQYQIYLLIIKWQSHSLQDHPASFQIFPDIAELYSISQGGTTTRNNLGVEVSASQIHSTTDKTATRASGGLKPKKSRAQLALESQEQFDHAEKASKKAGKASANLKKQAKQLQPRKEKASQLLDDFSELENVVDKQV